MVHARERLYFDQAATSWPKLPEAVEAADKFVRNCGATSGRGGYESARVADHWVAQARNSLARLVGAEDASQVALCTSGTHALNALLLGWLQAGDRVLTSATEHNSVLRPLEHLRRERGLDVAVAPCDADGWVDIDAGRTLMGEGRTRAVVLSHASNVTGRRQDLLQWSRLAREHDAFLIVDASQTIGYVPVSMKELGIDVLVAAGHKGLGALAGTGFFVAPRDVQDALRPLMFGGTGISSEHLDFNPTWPQSVEVGNFNMPGVVSMAVAAQFWSSDGAGNVMDQWHGPLQHLVRSLRTIAADGRLRVIGHTTAEPRADSTTCEWLPIVSLELEGWDIHEASAVLDGNFGLETRAGFHCAALIHRALGTHDRGGTLRLSLGHTTTVESVELAAEALGALLQADW